jgi:hypothetical protein
MKTFKLLMIYILFAIAFFACSFPNSSSSPIQITDQSPVDSVATLTLRVNPTQTKMGVVTPKFIAPLGTAVPISTLIPPNTPVWSVYNYTCELATGGGTMTMNLAWTDRSNSEEGYKVYRDEQVIATLTANSTVYVDVAFVATGKTLSYSVEAFNKDWHASTSTITHGCQ